MAEKSRLISTLASLLDSRAPDTIEDEEIGAKNRGKINSGPPKPLPLICKTRLVGGAFAETCMHLFLKAFSKKRIFTHFALAFFLLSFRWSKFSCTIYFSVRLFIYAEDACLGELHSVSSSIADSEVFAGELRKISTFINFSQAFPGQSIPTTLRTHTIFSTVGL